VAVICCFLGLPIAAIALGAEPDLVGRLWAIAFEGVCAGAFFYYAYAVVRKQPFRGYSISILGGMILVGFVAQLSEFLGLRQTENPWIAMVSFGLAITAIVIVLIRHLGKDEVT